MAECLASGWDLFSHLERQLLVRGFTRSQSGQAAAKRAGDAAGKSTAVIVKTAGDCERQREEKGEEDGEPETADQDAGQSQDQGQDQDQSEQGRDGDEHTKGGSKAERSNAFADDVRAYASRKKQRGGKEVSETEERVVSAAPLSGSKRKSKKKERLRESD